MPTAKLQLADIRYNPETCAFEAIVCIHDGAETYSYPTHFCAPLNAEHGVITRGLIRKAQQAHDAPRPGLRLHRVPVAPAPCEVSRPVPKLLETPLMLRMLRALAA